MKDLEGPPDATAIVTRAKTEIFSGIQGMHICICIYIWISVPNFRNTNPQLGRVQNPIMQKCLFSLVLAVFSGGLWIGGVSIYIYIHIGIDIEIDRYIYIYIYRHMYIHRDT